MIVHIDESWILEVAEGAGSRDPGVDEYGVPVAAAARHRGELLDHPVDSCAPGNLEVPGPPYRYHPIERQYGLLS